MIPGDLKPCQWCGESIDSCRTIVEAMNCARDSAARIDGWFAYLEKEERDELGD